MEQLQFLVDKILYQNNVKYIKILFAFSKSERYINTDCLKQHQKQFPIGPRGNKFQLKFREIVQTQLKFHHQFHFASTFKCFI